MHGLANDRQLLKIAIATSVALHAALLAVRFAPPESLRLRPFDTGLAVILVNARHESAPLQADALAQANLDGGGNADAGRARSPLPNRGLVSDGVQLEPQRRRLAELEKEQQRLMSQVAAHKMTAADAGEKPDRPQLDGRDIRSVEQIQEIARREAEIARDIADYQKRPLKTQLTPSTKVVAHALYYTALQKKIEQTGTLNFPQRDGQKLYGELIVYIPVAEDGRLYEKEGGPRVERGSGNPALDAAALAIVRRSAPFGRLSASIAGDSRERVWEVIARLTFTRDQQLHAQPAGGER